MPAPLALVGFASAATGFELVCWLLFLSSPPQPKRSCCSFSCSLRLEASTSLASLMTAVFSSSSILVSSSEDSAKSYCWVCLAAGGSSFLSSSRLVLVVAVCPEAVGLAFWFFCFLLLCYANKSSIFF